MVKPRFGKDEIAPYVALLMVHLLLEGVVVELCSWVPHVGLPLPDGSRCWVLNTRSFSGALDTSRGTSFTELLTMAEHILFTVLDRVSDADLEVFSAPG